MGLAQLGGTSFRSKPFPGWPQHGPPEETDIDLLHSGTRVGYRNKVKEFKDAFSAIHSVRYAITCVNGTIALEPDDPCVTSQPHDLLTLCYAPSTFNGLDHDMILNALQAEGIPAKAPYPYPLYRNLLFQRKNLPPCTGGTWEPAQDHESMNLPESECVCGDGIWLDRTFFPGTDKDVEDIVESSRKLQAIPRHLLPAQRDMQAEKWH